MNGPRYGILTVGTISWFAPFPFYYARGSKGPRQIRHAAAAITDAVSTNLR